MEKSKKHYTPPKVEVYPVALENNIMLQSRAIEVSVEDWKPDETVEPDNGDIYIPI